MVELVNVPDEVPAHPGKPHDIGTNTNKNLIHRTIVFSILPLSFVQVLHTLAAILTENLSPSFDSPLLIHPGNSPGRKGNGRLFHGVDSLS